MKWVVWFDGLVGWVRNCPDKASALARANLLYGPRNYAVIPCERKAVSETKAGG